MILKQAPAMLAMVRLRYCIITEGAYPYGKYVIQTGREPLPLRFECSSKSGKQKVYMPLKIVKIDGMLSGA